jgi:LmbE family N-acetylglucosaminyl deacetylase
MLPLTLRGERLSVLCLGAHSDDIEIGVGGTLLSLMDGARPIDVHWCVLSASGPRAQEALEAANTLLRGASTTNIELATFRDGYFNRQGAELKDWFEGLKARVSPDVVFTHRRDDAHQDHREISQLTWNTFRNHLILEYEIPKWDGDLGQPNAYMWLTKATMERKVAILMEAFGTQRSKDWFDPATFLGLARLRGMECRAPEGFAEAFTARKLVLTVE